VDQSGLGPCLCEAPPFTLDESHHVTRQLGADQLVGALLAKELRHAGEPGIAHWLDHVQVRSEEARARERKTV
jgi:hypothetical protein